MYKIYVDKDIYNSNKLWRKTNEYKDTEVIIYNGFADLILKLEMTDKNIIFMSDFRTPNDCYEKVKILRGKYPLSVVNVVYEGNLNVGELKRVGLNELIKPSRTKAITLVLEQSFRLADTYANQDFVRVDSSNIITIDRRDINLVTVVGSSGVGKTTVAANLASAYAEFGLKVCLVDFSLQFGDVGLFTNIKPTFTVYDLAMNNLDSNANLETFINKVNSNLYVLPAPVLPEQADYITRTMVPKIIKALSLTFDTVIFDTSALVNDLNLELYKLSQQIVLVTTKDLAALKNTKLIMDILAKLKVDEKIKFVLNKHDAPMYLVENEVVKKMFNLDIMSLVPYNDVVAVNALNMGVPFIYSYPREDVSDAIRTLMSTVRYNCIVGDYKVEKN